jgi:hypothetical protein
VHADAEAFCERAGIPLVQLEAQPTPAATKRMATKALPLFRQLPPPPPQPPMKNAIAVAARGGRKRKVRSEVEDLSASAAAMKSSKASDTAGYDDAAGSGSKRACLRSASKLKALAMRE